MRENTTVGGDEGVTEAAETAGFAKRVPAGSLLLSFKLSIGRVAIAERDVFPNEAIAWIRPRAGVLQDYLRLALQGVDWSGLGGRAVKGVTLNKSSLDAVPLTIPPLVEQRRIADLIGAVDDAIERAEASQKAAVEAEHRLRDSVFRGIDAKPVRAGSKFDMMLGRQKTKPGIEGKVDLPYLRAANIGDSVLNLADVNTMGFAPSDVDAIRLRRGDVVLVEGGSVGLAAMWNAEIEGPVGFDKHVIRIRPRRSESISDFALHWAKWSRDSGAFDAQATGITIKALGFARASAMPVPDISVADQEALLAPVIALAMTRDRLAEALASLRSLRAKTLSALLSGEHEIPESYHELMEVAA